MPKTIEQRTTFPGYLNDLVLACVLGGLLSLGIGIITNSPAKAYQWLKIGGVIVLLAVIVRYYYMLGLLQKRDQMLVKLAVKNKWGYGEQPSKALTFETLGNPALLRLNTARDQHFRNLVQAKDFMYADFSYALYGDFKGWEYQRTIVYYSIVSLRLPRALPNVVFDSLKSRRQQFKTVYDQNQGHRLEGDFNEYFATYFIKDYTIDSLSFITPEVMEALIAASDYDIEIRDDRLLLYGPLLMNEQQLQTMNDLAQTIKRKLHGNIIAYRDERAAPGKTAKTVSAAGMSLKLKRFDARRIIIYNVLFFTFWIIFEIYRR